MSDDLSWCRAAACIGAGEMVSGADDQSDPTIDLDGCAAVLLAKKICATCPVADHCLQRVEQVADTWGISYTQGVWAGLTHQERATWRALRITPRPCERCQLLCVPVNRHTKICNACKPRQRIYYDDYRDHIVKLVEAGCSAGAVAQALTLNKDSVISACKRWQVKIVVEGQRGRTPKYDCGTPAAKRRHRNHGESWESCACKHITWSGRRRR